MYKAICFDYNGVLYGVPGNVFTGTLCDELHVDKESFRTAFFHHNKKLNKGEITKVDFWKLVLDELHIPEKFQDVLDIERFLNEQNSLNQSILSLVHKLHTYYKTGLLSNNHASLKDELTQNGVAKAFDAIHISEITGFVKPEPKAFEYLAQELDVSIVDLVFIDDSQKSLSTAAECGYTPILFESYEKLVSDLSNKGVTF